MIALITALILTSLYGTEVKTEDSGTYEIESTIEKVEEVKEPVIADAISEEYVGTYELTAYMETGYACADGVYPKLNYTVACNDSRLWHKWIRIDGLGTYYVHDTGGMASNVIDIYMGDYNTCINFGRQSAKVYIVN